MTLPAKALSPLTPSLSLSLLPLTEDLKKSGDLCALGEQDGGVVPQETHSQESRSLDDLQCDSNFGRYPSRSTSFGPLG